MFKKIDAYLIFNPANRFYFTKLNTSYGCVILTEKEKHFITDFRYELVARDSLLDYEVTSTSFSQMYSNITKEFKRLGVKTVGYEDNFFTVSEFKELKSALEDFTLKPAGQIIEEMRTIKTEEEINNIASAQQIAQKALAKVIPRIKQGVTERDVSAELVYEIIKNGAESLSFDTIIAFGENSALPHHNPGNKKLEKNDLILIDFGAKYNGYCSDMTRTFCLAEPNRELKLAHSIVLEAQFYALKHLKAGMTGHEADSLAREFIKANGYGKEFGHALGHGVGIEIHENPRLGIDSNTILQENMVVSVEPGIYIEDLGGVRIEDLVVIKKDGIINLTNFNKNLNI